MREQMKITFTPSSCCCRVHHFSLDEVARQNCYYCQSRHLLDETLGWFFTHVFGTHCVQPQLENFSKKEAKMSLLHTVNPRFFFTGGCFLPLDAVSLICDRTWGIGYYLTLYPVTTRGTGTLTTGLLGWWPVRLIRHPHTGYIPIPTPLTPVNNSANKWCLLKKSNLPIMKWTKMAR